MNDEQKIIEFFRETGKEIKLTVITPFVINNPDKLWYIDSGSINLSSTKYVNNQPIGKLYNFHIFNKGEIFFGFKQKNEESLIFLADAEEESIIYELDIKLIKDKINSKEFSSQFAYLVDKWVINIYNAINEDTTVKRPSINHLLDENVVNELVENSYVSTNHKILWFKNDNINNFLFNGHIEMPGKNEEIYFPVTKKSFLKVKVHTKVDVFNTENIITNNSFWNGLNLLHESTLESDLFEAGQYDVLSENWLEQKYKSISSEFNNSLELAKSIFEPSDSLGSTLSIQKSRSNLFNVCSIVAEYAGIELIMPPNLQNLKDPIDDICRYSGIRYREILLEGKWFKNTGGGALLGFLKDSNTPVALLPDKKNKHKVVDLVNNTVFEVSKTNYDKIAKISYVFYKAFPRKKLNIRDLIKFAVSKDRKDYKRLMYMGLFTALLGLAAPILTAIIFDYIIPNAQRGQLVHIAFALLMAAIGGIFFELVKNISILRIRGIIDSNLQAALWDRLLDLPTTFFRKFTAGDLANRSIGITQILNTLSGVVITSIIGGIFSILNFSLLFYYSKSLAFLALLLASIHIFIMYFLGKKQVTIQKEVLKYNGKSSGIILQLLNGITVLKITGNEIKAFIHWFKNFILYRESSIKVSKLQNIQRIVSNSFQLIALIFIYIAIIKLANNMTTGQFLAFNAAYGAFIMAMMNLSDSAIFALQTIPVFNRMKPILEELPENDGTKAAPEELKGGIELNNIMFRYQRDTPLILNNISIRIKKGDYIALVGPSGSGKSTIVRLLLGFNKMEGGTILYDGQDLNHIDPKLLRKQIGVVLQDGGLIAGDIYSNIIGSSPYLTLNDAWEAAKAAAFDEDINNMPMGMFTIVSEDGGTLSGGQRQRLMIARALVHKPKILIFDEATSALDNRTQAVVTQSLNQLQVTRIVVAHRLSTIKDADKIVYLENGIIEESGEYEELMKLKGKFYQLAARQIE